MKKEKTKVIRVSKLEKELLKIADEYYERQRKKKKTFSELLKLMK